MSHNDNFTKQYYWGMDTNTNKYKELTKEEKLKRIEDYIEKFDIEHDENYIYLYKAVNLDGTNIHQTDNKIIYEVGKTFTEKCDQDVNNTCAKGLHAGTYKIATEFGRGISLNPWVITPLINSWTILSNEPTNPSKLYEQPNFRLFKVKIHKEHVIVPNNTDGKVRCNQMEIIEEVELKNTLGYRLTSFVELPNLNEYKITFKVYNGLNSKEIDVSIISDTLDITKENINSKIKARLEQMQKIYDKFQEISKLNGSLLE